MEKAVARLPPRQRALAVRMEAEPRPLKGAPTVKVLHGACSECGPFWLFTGDKDPVEMHLFQYHPEISHVGPI